jgi:hypothetical protein
MDHEPAPLAECLRHVGGKGLGSAAKSRRDFVAVEDVRGGSRAELSFGWHAARGFVQTEQMVSCRCSLDGEVIDE